MDMYLLLYHGKIRYNKILSSLSNLSNLKWQKSPKNKVGDFDELIAQISQRSDDIRWLRYHAATDIYGRLTRLFCQKRDKDDTDKAIYRMCCIGLVEDVTIDYLSQTYELKIRKRTDEEFKQYMEKTAEAVTAKTAMLLQF